MAIQTPATALRMNMNIDYHVKAALKEDAVVRLTLKAKSRINIGHLEAIWIYSNSERLNAHGLITGPTRR